MQKPEYKISKNTLGETVVASQVQTSEQEGFSGIATFQKSGKMDYFELGTVALDLELSSHGDLPKHPPAYGAPGKNYSFRNGKVQNATDVVNGLLTGYNKHADKTSEITLNSALGEQARFNSCYTVKFNAEGQPVDVHVSLRSADTHDKNITHETVKVDDSALRDQVLKTAVQARVKILAEGAKIWQEQHKLKSELEGKAPAVNEMAATQAGAAPTFRTGGMEPR